MTVQHPLTDEAIRAAIARRATRAGDRDLRERVLAATATVPQRRGWRVRVERALAPPERRATLTLAAVVMLLLAVAIGAAVVGSQIDRRIPAPLGGLAYISEGDLYVAGPLGESPRLVWDVPASEDLAPAHLAWLDPETVLLQLYSEADRGVHLVNVTTGVHRLIDAGGYVALSPDHRLVAIEVFDESATPQDRVRLIDLASGERVGEIPGPIGGYPPMWSPDGRSIVGKSVDTIYRVEVASGVRTILAAGLCCGLSPHWPTWSADGTQVVYIDYHEPVARDCRFRCGTLWSVAATGGEPMRLTPELGSEVHPTVSPDGRWIADFDESHADLVVIAPDGSGQRVLARDFPAPVEVPVTGEPNVAMEVSPLPEVHWDPDSAGLTYLTSATLWHVTLAGVATRIELPAMSEFARQVLP